MFSRFASRLLVAGSAAIVLPLLALPDVAVAQPGNGPLIQTTCNCDQLYAAVRTEAPKAAAELDNRPAAQQKLQDFVVMSVEQRQQELARLLSENPHWQNKIDEQWDTPEGQEKAQTMARIANTCHNY